MVFNQVLLFAIFQFLAYEIANERGKEKLEPRGDLQENVDYIIEKSYYTPLYVNRIRLGKPEITFS